MDVPPKASATRLLMTDVNYAEVKYSIVKKDGARAWAEAAKVLQGLPIDFHSTTRALADIAADFKARFKMSLADAFAAALAKDRKAELVTGDLEFKPLEREIKVHWLRQSQPRKVMRPTRKRHGEISVVA